MAGPKPFKSREVRPFRFVWQIPYEGFHWVTGNPFQPPWFVGGHYTPNSPADTSINSSFLMAKTPSSGGRRFRTYNPLEDETGLFLGFAAVRLSQKEGAVLEFANKYGDLGMGVEQRFAVSTGLKSPTTEIISGETLSDWQSEIFDMRMLVDLWHALKSNDVGRLREWIAWDESEVDVRIDYAQEGLRKVGLIAAASVNPETLQTFTKGDLIQPGWVYLQRSVNQRLVTHPSTARLLADATSAGGGGPSLFLVPVSLIAALWFQFARAIDGDRDYRICEQCRRWFEIGYFKRADAKHCSQACKQKRYRDNLK